jgi:hypothetical protein
VLVTVSVCAAEVEPTLVGANVKLLGRNETGNGEASPVPEVASVCWVPGAFSVFEVIVTLSFKAIEGLPLLGCVTGAKSMVSVQLPAIAS